MESDLYSFLTGRIMFSGGDAMEDLQKKERR